MSNTLRHHLEEESGISQEVIDMVCRMFAEESEQIINRMNAMDPLVREPVLRAIDRYHYAMNRNNLAVMQIGTILANTGATNDTGFNRVSNG